MRTLKFVLSTAALAMLWSCGPPVGPNPDGGVVDPCPNMCNGACTNLSSDTANCGTCGTTCGANDTCLNGGCTALCSLEVKGTLPAPGAVEGNLPPGLAGVVEDYTCQKILRGPEQIYTLRVPAFTGMQIKAEAAWDTTLAVRRVCDSLNSEVGCDTDSGMGFASTLHLALDPGAYNVMVEHGLVSGNGAFTLRATPYTLAPNAFCGSAVALVPNMSVMGDIGKGITTKPLGKCGSADAGPPQVFYKVTVPAMASSEVRVVPTGDGRPVIRLADDCNTEVCAEGGYIASLTDGAPAVMPISNMTATAKTYILSVSRTKATDGAETFTISQTDNMLPANVNCNAAIDLAAMPSLTGQNAGAATGIYGPTPSCGNGTGRVLYYRATVPANGKLALNVNPTGPTAWDPIVRVVDACAATMCIQNRDNNRAGAPESQIIDNSTGGSPKMVVIAVGSTNADTTGTFSIAAGPLTDTAGTNLTCATATAVTAGSTVISATTTGGGAAPITACATPGTGPTAYYSVQVAANSKLTVNALPASGWNPAIRLIDGCAATACLATADANAAGGIETATYTNSDAAAKTVIVAVTANNAGSVGTFDLNVNVTPNQ